MRLHEAIALAAATQKLHSFNWNTCALGGAANVAGIPQLPEGYKYPWGRIYAIGKVWPWLLIVPNPNTDMAYQFITVKFDNEVTRGYSSIENLIDYVRHLEMIYDEQKFLPLPVTVSETIEEEIYATV